VVGGDFNLSSFRRLDYAGGNFNDKITEVAVKKIDLEQ